MSIKDPGRDTILRFDCAALKPDCKSGASVPTGSDCCSAHANCCEAISNFDRLVFAGDSHQEYDLSSIMHYTANALALPGTVTLVATKAGVSSFPQSTRPGDTNRVCKLYKDQCPRAVFCKSLDCPATCSIRTTPCHTVQCEEDQVECKMHRKECTFHGCESLKGWVM
jgi:hypothetical protein